MINLVAWSHFSLLPNALVKMSAAISGELVNTKSILSCPEISCIPAVDTLAWCEVQFGSTGRRVRHSVRGIRAAADRGGVVPPATLAACLMS